MEFENNKNANNPTFILEGDGYYFDRLLLRDTSLGCSSRIYFRSCEGVPFQWETQPGTPINPPESDVILPLTPPPGHQNPGLLKPCLGKQKKHSFEIKNKGIMFWKKMKKKQRKFESFDRVESLGPLDSDGEFVGSSSSSSLYYSDFPHSSSRDKATIMGEGSQHTETLILDKILSRNSSANQSNSPINYYREPQGVPYKWEKQPGKSITPPRDEFPIPPPTPPPAFHCKDLPLPCLDRLEDLNTRNKKLWCRRKLPLVPLFFRGFFRSNSSCSSRSGRGLRDQVITCSPWNIGAFFRF